MFPCLLVEEQLVEHDREHLVESSDQQGEEDQHDQDDDGLDDHQAAGRPRDLPQLFPDFEEELGVLAEEAEVGAAAAELERA
ncbi:hypothetical protein D3C78_1738560 [compost metagenome]